MICKYSGHENHQKGKAVVVDVGRIHKGRQSKKTGCKVKMKVMERVDRSWDLKYLKILSTTMPPTTVQ